MMFLYEELEVARRYGAIHEMPAYIPENLNPEFELRPYQTHAFENFITYFEGETAARPTQVLFHMATGSGKTLIMAGLILYLYKLGYRNFLFFVNLSNIVEKTKNNFLNPMSAKYLFADEITIDGERVRVNQVNNFQYSEPDAVNICFTTTQALHTDMWYTRENCMSFDDFDEQKVVLISDESHHLNVETKRKRSDAEEKEYISWERTVKNIFERNADNVLLEFTATCDLSNQMIRAAYENKIVFNYDLARYYSDGYSKEILTLRSDLPVMQRVLQALILSQYRLKVFEEHRLAIKPVVLLKSAKVDESKRFMEEFLQFISRLTGRQIQEISHTDGEGIMDRAYRFFAKRGITPDDLAFELRNDFSREHCISVNDEKAADRNQIIINSLEDADNPYRAVFEVRKLDEGWDVLNLFDIVRLYETRQSGGKKISPATISEAQLIGRGARYCPFRIDDEQLKYQRKYDDDTENDLRACETLYYHCQNERHYVTELHAALREIGLDLNRHVDCRYTLKETFKEEEIYRNGTIFLNDRVLKGRWEVHGLSPDIRTKTFFYKAAATFSGSDRVMLDDRESTDYGGEHHTVHMCIADIAVINYALVNKALMKYPVYKFNTLKSYFPNLSSTREFIMSEDYLGSVHIDIQTREEMPALEDMHRAVSFAVGQIAESISSIKETYRGTEEFTSRYVRDVFYDKTVSYMDPAGEGIGISQRDPSVRDEWWMDLSAEDWFAYTDNFGTSEEKAFVAYFKSYVDDLRQIYDKIFLVRNEQEFHIYSFDDGLRFEPDYVLFLRKDKEDGYEQFQIFVEPKGDHLLGDDAWKEDFLLQIKGRAIPVKMFVDDNDYRIWGMHFFNQNNRMAEFDEEFAQLLSE